MRHFGMLGSNNEVIEWAKHMAKNWYGCSCDPLVEINRCPDCSDVQEIEVTHFKPCRVRQWAMMQSAWLN